MTHHIELIYDSDCPNVSAARTALSQACAAQAVSSRWLEWDRADPSAPQHVLQFGSPTILVDGEDVAGNNSSSDAQACRVYRTASGELTGVPPSELIAARLGGSTPTRSTWLGGLAALGAGLASFLPVLTCPACWPAYAGVLSALGVSFVNYTPYQTPMVIIPTGVTLGCIALGARKRGARGPLLVGAVAAVVMLVGRLAVSSDLLVYVGAAALIASAVWNAWPQSSAVAGDCEACPA